MVDRKTGARIHEMKMVKSDYRMRCLYLVCLFVCLVFHLFILSMINVLFIIIIIITVVVVGVVNIRSNIKRPKMISFGQNKTQTKRRARSVKA